MSCSQICYSQPLLLLAEFTENFLSTYLKAVPLKITLIVLFFVHPLKLQFSAKLSPQLYSISENVVTERVYLNTS